MTKVLLADDHVLVHGEQHYAVRAFKAGASGYLRKESAIAELVAAVTKVASGGRLRELHDGRAVCPKRE